MSTIRAVYYTHRTAEWHQFALDLGLTLADRSGSKRAEFDGGGILGIHPAGASPGASGITELHVLVDDLDDAETALHAAGVMVSRGEVAGEESTVTARTRSGVAVHAVSGARRARGALRVQPIWCEDDEEEPLRVFRALGLRERVRAASGTWIDFEADSGGLVAFHTGMSDAMTLSFEYAANLDDLAKRLTDTGHENSIVDEAYNRTLLVRTPDDWMLSVNEEMTDLYGYRRAPSSATEVSQSRG